MTKERELLERAASMLPFISEENRGFYPAVALVSEIRFHLANDEKTHNTQSVYPEQQALHPEQKPLFIYEIQIMWRKYTKTRIKPASPFQAFIAGFRAAEQHYGINESVVSLNDTISANRPENGH